LAGHIALAFPLFRHVLFFGKFMSDNDHFHAMRVLKKRALRKWRMTSEQRREINAMFGWKSSRQDLYLSDIRARRKLRRVMFNVLRRTIKHLEPDHMLCFVTFADDCGMTSDRNPILRVTQFHGKIDRAARRMGMSLLVMMELQGIKNYPGGGAGRTLLLNAHAIGVTRDIKAARSAAEKLNDGRGWTCKLGIDPIHIQPAAKSPVDVERMSNYLNKMPIDVKNRMPARGKPGRYILMNTIGGYRPDFALRHMEGLSQVRMFGQGIFSVGREFKAAKTSIKRQMVAWHQERLNSRKCALVDFKARETWRELRRTNGKPYLRPFKII